MTKFKRSNIRKMGGEKCIVIVEVFTDMVSDYHHGSQEKNRLHSEMVIYPTRDLTYFTAFPTFLMCNRLQSSSFLPIKG